MRDPAASSPSCFSSSSPYSRSFSPVTHLASSLLPFVVHFSLLEAAAPVALLELLFWSRKLAEGAWFCLHRCRPRPRTRTSCRRARDLREKRVCAAESRMGGRTNDRNMEGSMLDQGKDRSTHLFSAHDEEQLVDPTASTECRRQQISAEAGQRRRRTPRSHGLSTRTALLSMIVAAPVAMSQNCISLKGSTTCPAFQSASISTDSTLVGLYPFLSFVSSTSTFDEQLSSYVSTSYVQEKYQTLLGCGNINLANTTNLYARFTTTVICNAIIQNSRDTCALTTAESQPVCADTCANQAESEALIIANNALCSNPGTNADNQIRADFTNCALPTDSLTGSCIEGAANEPENCGFGNSTIGLCQYCGAGGQNSTDTCCYNSNAQQRCAGVVLPTITAFMTFSTSSPTASPTSSTSQSSSAAPVVSKESHHGLSGGAIAGIVVGSVVGAALLVGLIVLLVLCLRRRPSSRNGSILNQPTPPRKGPPSMTYNPVTPAANTTPEGYEVLPGGRIARMSALEGHSGDSPPRDNRPGAAAVAGITGYSSRKNVRDHSSSDEFADSPTSNTQAGILRPPPAGRRNGSLSSNSVLGMDDPQSPNSGSGGDMSSPQGLASQQSEQLPFFKDYYSQDEIHPGDKVSTLWAYQPRAGDEFALERGDMLKVVGIWDDGWATGIMIDERADEWDAKRNPQRDSGVSNTSGRRGGQSPVNSGEIKAFPLVCVCLPDHWRKTIEGDGSTETGSTTQGQTTA